MYPRVCPQILCPKMDPEVLRATGSYRELRGCFRSFRAKSKKPGPCRCMLLPFDGKCQRLLLVSCSFCLKQFGIGSILCCIELYCIILYIIINTTLYFIVLYYSLLYHIILYHNILYYIIFYYIIFLLYYIILYYIIFILYYIVLYYIISYCIILYYIIL